LDRTDITLHWSSNTGTVLAQTVLKMIVLTQKQPQRHTAVAKPLSFHQKIKDRAMVEVMDDFNLRKHCGKVMCFRPLRIITAAHFDK
jgi:hypothetical protein